MTGYSILLVFFKKLSFILFMVRCFFLLIHFLVVEDYESSKITSHVLSVPLNLECVRILSWTIYFFSNFNCLPDDVLYKIAIWADDNAFNWSYDKPSDCRNKLWFDLKNMKIQNQKHRKMQFCIQLNIDISEIILYLQTNLYRLKTKNISSLIFISTLIK